MLEMGGYGAYIWPAYAIVLSGLVWVMLRSIKMSRIIKRQIKSSRNIK